MSRDNVIERTEFEVWRMRKLVLCIAAAGH